jgi:hypothetical protein
VFRQALTRHAGPSIRASVLASERPELEPLAWQLVTEIEDPEALVSSFEAAAKLAEAEGEASSPDADPELLIDGPKRKFSWVHMVWAAVILGLTIWHYWLR